MPQDCKFLIIILYSYLTVLSVMLNIIIDILDTQLIIYINFFIKYSYHFHGMRQLLPESEEKIQTKHQPNKLTI